VLYSITLGRYSVSLENVWLILWDNVVPTRAPQLDARPRRMSSNPSACRESWRLSWSDRASPSPGAALQACSAIP
jgi:hypothetical protein